jgi:IrrE N-terminal-like domain
MMKKTQIDWRMEQNRQEKAAELAESIVQQQGIVEPPVDPAFLVRDERQLRLIGDDFRDVFDGMLEYHRSKRRFLLFYNTKYGVYAGEIHPRTRFSLAHELGHFFIDRHRIYLMTGGRPHGSRGEFTTDSMVEREADAFAAALLMPKSMLRPMVNRAPIALADVERFANIFQTSLVSTAIRSVQLSDFPCAVVGIRAGRIAWGFLSESLREGGCYGILNGPLQSPTARDAWQAFEADRREKLPSFTASRHWFRTSDRDYLQDLTVAAEFLPVPVMHTLLAFLTIREQDLYPELR